jgi:uncharacterized membrane protein
MTKKSPSMDKKQHAAHIRKEIYDLIKKDNPDFEENSEISLEELNRYRKMHLSSLIKGEEDGELSKLEQEVLDAISTHKVLLEKKEGTNGSKVSFGQKLADNIAKFGGSWGFVILFFIFLSGWMTTNLWFFFTKAFDPYPFILLNLILSCLAAVQAPIIMMSQNRMEEIDRKRAEHDYKVNLKAELEIRLLDEKIEDLITHQHKVMLNIQTMQTDYLESILNQIKKNSTKNKAKNQSEN